MKKRTLEALVVAAMKKYPVVALFGARRIGKTYLMHQIAKKIGNAKVLIVQGDDLDTSELLASGRLSVLKRVTEGYRYLFIDEAQMIPDIGRNLKLIADNIPGVKVFITGSSAMELHQKTGEPLTGRSRFFRMHPFTLAELGEKNMALMENLDSRLIYGMYPQVILANTDDDRKDVLESIRNGYLLKDLLTLDNMKDAVFMLKLLRLIAFQIGNDISYSSLAIELNVNKKTVIRYLDLLEKCYIIFSLGGLSRNLRKEFSKTPRYYFWDNGVRNSIIGNYAGLQQRDDKGKLWENFVISERLKMTGYLNPHAVHYFWRTYDQQEIDLVEEVNGKFSAFECKLNDHAARFPKAFDQSYPGSTFHVINRTNFTDFLL